MTRRFHVASTPFQGLTVVERQRILDDRGYLERLYCAAELEQFGVDKPIRQITHTLTHKTGTVRGIHFRHPPMDELKIVTCLKGRVFDVTVDLRHASPTFLNWHAEELSEENGRLLIIPEGFAHAFQALEPDCEILYLHTVDYSPEHEDGINATDPRLAIPWPEPIADRSEKDTAFRPIAPNFEGLRT